MFARLPALVSLALFAVSPAASAYNLLKNGAFNGGSDGWNLSSSGGGQSGYESYFGTPAGGSLRLQSYNFGAISHADQCVDIHKWFALDFSLRKFVNGESGTGTHPFKLDVYDAADCGGNVLSTIMLPDAGVAITDGNPATGWIEVSVLGTPLPAGAISAKVSLD